MGNCLPFIYFNSQTDDEDTQHLDNTRRSIASQHQSTAQSHELGSRSGGPSSTSRRARSHVSSYVNQLYTSSTDYGEDRDREAIDEKRKARARAIVENLRVAEYVEGNTPNDECAICMLDFEPKQLIRYLPCQHIYHVHCIDNWLLRSLTCPSCMEPVDSALLSAFTSNSGVMDISSIPNKSSSP
ncbi:RING-type domain-containing protein [Aphelenchoides besseyi]|nr:RING-type domain-containing protein [Aphelenchoides besseyi]KAI6217514.1 RING-type domain-containing protein [Aphelenchoides besseyi]